MDEEDIDFDPAFTLDLGNEGKEVEQSIPDPGLFLAQETRPLNKEEKKWVQSAAEAATATPEKIQELKRAAPTLPALRSLEAQLEKYNQPIPASQEAWQAFVMAKYFEQALDIDPKISKPALDALARTNIVGLHKEVQEISITTKSVVELEGELMERINALLKREEKTIEGTRTAP